MHRSINFTVFQGSLAEYRDWDDLRADLRALDCDGLELIWGGEDFPPDLPRDLVTGYHLTFYPDWLDFYRWDTAALSQKFDSLQECEEFYGGRGKVRMLQIYREDLQRAAALGAKYIVFHVSDISLEESYTYDWLHTDEEVVEASVEVINELLGSRDQGFDFLVENQWWPGFRFTDPELTRRMMDGIRYPRKGILLDTGHLMNTNLDLRTEQDGLAYLERMLDRHAGLLHFIKGMHLHQSLSGEYVRTHVGAVPDGRPAGYAARFGANYPHILAIDQHRPWHDPAAAQLIRRIAPGYLTHELSASGRAARMEAVRTQVETLRKGGLAHG